MAAFSANVQNVPGKVPIAMTKMMVVRAVTAMSGEGLKVSVLVGSTQ